MKNKENAVLLSILIGFLLLFIAMSITVFVTGGNPLIDTAIRDFAYDIRGDKGGFIFWVFRILTEFGDIIFIVFIAVLGLFYTKLDNRFLVFVFGMLFAVLLNTAFKEVFSRERPYEIYRWMEEESKSFPSGHSVNAAYIFSMIMFTIYKSNYKKSIKLATYITCGTLIPIVMISRIILGVHFFTDTIAGASLGIMVASLCMLLNNLLTSRNILTEGLLKKSK